ncbi:flagellin [Breoghania sp. JC706]|uniref:flagellin N-terminal helical domain-containing protein n=2 Tax=unclassified Breoghania TaxID=2624130 RepID=UPI00300A0C76
MSDITLSSGVRQNLLSLQNTADLMSTTQNRLATGKKVNSALDNPTNFFTSSSLQSRASDLDSLMDSMSNGIKTLEAADNGLTSITNTLESMQSTLRQARQDKSFETASFTVDLGATPTGTEKLSLSGGAIGDTAVDIDLTNSTDTGTSGTSTAQNAYASFDLDEAGDSVSFDVTVDGAASPQTITFTQATVAAAGGDGSDGVDIDEAIATINDQLSGATASKDSGKIVITSDTKGTTSSVAVSNFAFTEDSATGSSGTDLTSAADLGFGTPVEAPGAATGGTVTYTAKTVDELVSTINNNTDLKGKIRASNDNGKLRLENQSTQDLTVTGSTTTGSIDGSTSTSTIDGNDVRADLSDQFNELRDQLDKLSDDASYNGINLLRGDNLTITFNETGTSTIDIQTKNGETINAGTLGISDIEEADLDSDTNIDNLLSTVKDAINTVRSQSSAFGSNLSIVENRQDFTKSMMNTLQTGADNLVLADGNEEAANMLALQTRQQLSSTALSLASQADQAPLRLF